MENMNSFTINNGFKEIAAKNEKGDVITVLRINVADARTAERFAHLIDNLDNISNEVKKEAQRLEQEEKVLQESEKVDTRRIISVNELKVQYIERCIDEINEVFGENTIQNVYKECYENRADFVPDESLLLQFVEKAIPVMNELFHQRFEENRKKYNVMRRGGRKNHKNKRQMIQGGANV